tara:strand:- start:97 stop:561 length:465 start_codon:yes stop_codon:yes gene_type:complete
MNQREFLALKERMASRPQARIAKAIMESDTYLKVGQAVANYGKLYLKGKLSFLPMLSGYGFGLSLRGREDSTVLRYLDEVIGDTYFHSDEFGEDNSLNEDMHLRKTKNGVVLEVGYVSGDSFRVMHSWKIDPTKMYTFSWHNEEFEIKEHDLVN